MTGIFGSNLAMVWLLAYIFNRWTHTKTFGDGFIKAVIINVPIMISYDLYFKSFMNLYTKTLVVTDLFVGAVLLGIVGGVVAWVQGYGEQKAG